MAADWRDFSKRLAAAGGGTRAVDLWRFLEGGPLSPEEFGRALNEEAAGEVSRGNGRVLLGYSMGGRLALHALLEGNHAWQAAIIVSADPGLEAEDERAARRADDADWATRALAGDWQQFLNAWNSQQVLGSAHVRSSEASAGLSRHRREIARSFVDWSLAAQSPLWARLAEIRIPVLWIAGENDPKFTALAKRAVEMMQGAELGLAPATGHRVPWDNPDWFLNRVRAFLHRGEG